MKKILTVGVVVFLLGVLLVIVRNVGNVQRLTNKAAGETGPRIKITADQSAQQYSGDAPVEIFVQTTEGLANIEGVKTAVFAVDYSTGIKLDSASGQSQIAKDESVTPRFTSVTFNLDQAITISDQPIKIGELFFSRDSTQPTCNDQYENTFCTVNVKYVIFKSEAGTVVGEGALVEPDMIRLTLSEPAKQGIDLKPELTVSPIKSSYATSDNISFSVKAKNVGSIFQEGCFKIKIYLDNNTTHLSYFGWCLGLNPDASTGDWTYTNTISAFTTIGTHTIRAVVDADNEVSELIEINNEATTTFVVAGPTPTNTPQPTLTSTPIPTLTPSPTMSNPRPTLEPTLTPTPTAAPTTPYVKIISPINGAIFNTGDSVIIKVEKNTSRAQNPLNYVTWEEANPEGPGMMAIYYRPTAVTDSGTNCPTTFTGVVYCTENGKYYYLINWQVPATITGQINLLSQIITQTVTNGAPITIAINPASSIKVVLKTDYPAAFTASKNAKIEMKYWAAQDIFTPKQDLSFVKVGSNIEANIAQNVTSLTPRNTIAYPNGDQVWRIKIPQYLSKVFNESQMRIRSGSNVFDLTSEELIAGDVDNNNVINTTDALRMFERLNSNNDSDKILYDLDGDGAITIKDVVIVISNVRLTPLVGE